MKRIAFLSLVWATFSFAENINGVIAVVNDELITTRAFNEALKRAEESAPREYLAHPEFKSRVLDQLITEELELQTAKMHGIQVTEDMVENTIAHTAAENGMSIAEFNRVLEQEGSTHQEFARHIHKQLSIQQLHHQQLLPKIDVSEHEIQIHLANHNPLGQFQSFELNHLMIDKSDDAASSLNGRIKAMVHAGSSFEKIEAQFDEKPAVKFQELGERTLSDLPTLFAPLAKDFTEGALIGPTENDSGYHYIYVKSIKQTVPEGLLARFKTADYQKLLFSDHKEALEATERLKSGQSIALMKMGASDHTETPMMSIPPEIRAQLTEPGIIGPIQHGGSWVVVNLRAINQPESLNEIAHTLAFEALREEKYRKVVGDWHVSLIDDAHIETFIDAQTA